MVYKNRAATRNWSSVDEFRSFLIKRLGQEWTVRIIAQLPDPGENEKVMSVAAVASRSDKVKVHVTHDRRTDVVLLSFGDGPQVPFEDFAVAKGEVELGDLANLAYEALKEPPGKTAFTLEATLRLISKWNGELARDLKPENHTMGHKLKEISKEFKTIMKMRSNL